MVIVFFLPFVVVADFVIRGGLTFGATGCNKMWGLTVTSGGGELFIDDYCSSSAYASGFEAIGAGWIIQELVLHNGVASHYANNELLETLDKSAWVSSDVKIRLGAEHTDNSFVKMSVADIILFNRALSSSERSQIHTYLGSRYFGSAEPETSQISLTSSPISVSLEVDDDDTLVLPWISSVSVGSTLAVGIPSVSCQEGVKYVFDSWSDGGDSHERVLSVGETDIVLQATYVEAGSCGSSVNDLPVTSGLVLYLNADEITDVNGNDKIKTWPDLSVYKSHLTPPKGFKRPKLRPGRLNGHNFVKFNGRNGALGREDVGMLPVGSSDRTVVMVVKYDKPGWGSLLFYLITANSSFRRLHVGLAGMLTSVRPGCNSG